MATLTCGRCRRSDLQIFNQGILVDPPGWSQLTITGQPIVNKTLCPTCTGLLRRLLGNEPTCDHVTQLEELRDELEVFKPQPMSQNCRDGKHAGVGDEKCHGCRCLCHAHELQAAA